MFDISKETFEYLSQVQSRLSKKCQSLFFSLAWCQWDFSEDLLRVFVLCGPVCSECFLRAWLSPDLKISSLGTAYLRNVEPFISHNLIHETQSSAEDRFTAATIPKEAHTVVLCRENIHTEHPPWPCILIASWQAPGLTRWKPGQWLHPSLYSRLLLFPLESLQNLLFGLGWNLLFLDH